MTVDALCATIGLVGLDCVKLIHDCAQPILAKIYRAINKMFFFMINEFND
jgi:hypothetical protein